MDFRVDIEEIPEDTEEGRKFRQEVGDFLDKELTPEVVSAYEKQRRNPYGDYPVLREFRRKLGAKGWLAPLAPQWPKEYGGVERSPEQKRILREELAAMGAGAEAVSQDYGGIQGPILLRHGSEEMKREYLPRIARGEIRFALGYTEPNAGTDLAALQMRAVRDGDDYIINGQKVYSTGAHLSTHHWLAARTDPDVPKHRGISLFIVDLSSPGITIRPLWTMADFHTNEVFYDNVRVPAKNRVGEENQGWSYIREALTIERQVLGSGAFTLSPTTLDKVIQYAKETEYKGRPLAKEPFVRQSLAQLAIEASISRLFNHRTYWVLMDKGTIPEVEGTIAKVWGSELAQRFGDIGTEILGLYGQLEPGSKWAPLEGEIEWEHRHAVHMSYGGGSDELLRSLIATRGMGLPREPRL